MIFSAVINGVESWRLVMEGKKTQTRRLVKYGEKLIQVAPNHKPDWKRVYCGGSDRVKWDTINTYAIQTGRAKPTVWYIRREDLDGYTIGFPPFIYAHETGGGFKGENVYQDAKTVLFLQDNKPHPRAYLENAGFREGRICITNIRQEDVRYITHEDAIAEGFPGHYAYIGWWTKEYDKRAWREGYMYDFSDGDESGITSHEQAWLSWLKRNRPGAYYQCWALDFEVVK